jgi:hypothetical protein
VEDDILEPQLVMNDQGRTTSQDINTQQNNISNAAQQIEAFETKIAMSKEYFSIQQDKRDQDTKHMISELRDNLKIFLMEQDQKIRMNKMYYKINKEKVEAD